MKRKWSQWPLMATLAAALALPGAAVAQQQGQSQQAQNQQADDSEAKEGKETKRLKVFELEHRTTQEITDLLTRHGQKVVARRLTRATRTPQGGQSGDLLIATDDDKKLLFVRGTDEKIEEVEKLIDALDRPADELKKHDFRGTRMIPITNGDATRINSVLNQLQLNAQVLNLGETGFILVRTEASDGEDGEERASQVEQAEEIISKLTDAAEDQDEEERDSDDEESTGDESSDDDSNGEDRSV